VTGPVSTSQLQPPHAEVLSSIRILAEQAFSRAAGAPLVGGNRVRLLKDATENYPAWIEAIQAAERSIHFEIYFIYEDHVGWQFAAALEAKARQGVHVRLLYDWLGALGKTSGRFWRSLRQAGVEVRCVNPPQLDSPFGWLSRDHRKMLTVDGRLGFVTGLCVGRMWTGEPARGLEPWRDTGVEVRGPAVADIERAFALMWAMTGEPIPEHEIPSREAMPSEGDVMLRVIASLPNLAGLYRLDQLVAAVARHSLWLTDAYFIGTTAYVQALRAAALDGVDIRLLVPGSSDIPFVRAVSRAGYRPLLEAGVRVFEWNGTMLHAKTAVADSRWARVGSTNLNLASWIGNWELDVAIEDEPFAQTMEEMYLDDLTHATEIILSAARRVHASGREVPQPSPLRHRGGGGSAGRAAAGVIRIGNTIGAALTNRRDLGPAEARIMVSASVILLILASVVVLLPWVVLLPLLVLAIWVAISLLIRAYHLWMQGKREKTTSPPTHVASS
jgi:cardiolipin synthase A/B